MKLANEILSLINLHQEGPYWDFKREWYGEKHKGDLLHDIICMANNLVNRDAYIIIGVDEEQDFSINDITDDPHRRNTQMMVTFLRDKKFAGDIRPVVLVETICLSGKKLDIIVVRNSTNTPFFLKDPFEKVRANHIYSRVQDTNTPVNTSADIQNVEYLWKKRFGLILSPLERIKVFLQHPEDWENMPSRCETLGKYYRYAPEYVIEHTMEPDDGRDAYEFYSFAQTDKTPRWFDIRLFYHQTLLREYGGASLDGGRFITISPDTGGFSLTDFDSWDISYKFLIKGTLEYVIYEFYYDNDDGDARSAHDKYIKCILVFESAEEQKRFVHYAQEHWLEKERYEQNIRLPYFPDLEDWNMDYFKTAYINSQILQQMLEEYRSIRCD